MGLCKYNDSSPLIIVLNVFRSQIFEKQSFKQLPPCHVQSVLVLTLTLSINGIWPILILFQFIIDNSIYYK